MRNSPKQGKALPLGTGARAFMQQLPLATSWGRALAGNINSLGYPFATQKANGIPVVRQNPQGKYMAWEVEVQQ